MGYRLGALAMIGLCCTATGHASSPPILPEATTNWAEVLEIERLAARSGLPGYDSPAGHWWMAPDGRLAVMRAAGADRRHAAVGRYLAEGPWLRVELDAHAVDLSRLDEEERAELEAWQREAALEAEAHATAATDAPDATAAAGADEAASAEDDAETAAFRRPRYLRVPYRGGELLVRETFLLMAANHWDGREPLELMAEAWRLPRGVELPQDGYTFAIQDPLQAGLPIELTRLLRVEPVVARVTEVIEDADTLQWKQQSARVHLRLDGGEGAGLYPGMTMRGLPPDEELQGEIVSAERDAATLRIELERFSPRDRPTLPTPGIRFGTRVAPGACGLDTSAAVRGKVRAVATPPELVRWDSEGYAWFELEIDQGAAQGLIVGDELDAEANDTDGEGRVLSVGSDRATVLWRAQRYDEEEPMRLPRAGDALVTPAWRRAEWDVFGAKDDSPVEL